MNPALNAGLNKLAKWRAVFAGWQLGTRHSTDAESQAVKHHREQTIILRAEVSALTLLLLRKGVFTQDDFESQLLLESRMLDTAYEKLFPGFESSNDGMIIDPKVAAETTKNWRP